MRPRLPETSAVMSPMRAAGPYLGDGLGAGEDAFDERGLAAALRPAEQHVIDIGGWYKAYGALPACKGTGGGRRPAATRWQEATPAKRVHENRGDAKGKCG